MRQLLVPEVCHLPGEEGETKRLLISVSLLYKIASENLRCQLNKDAMQR